MDECLGSMTTLLNSFLTFKFILKVSVFFIFFKLYVMVTFKPESMNPEWGLVGFVFVSLVEFVMLVFCLLGFFAVILWVSLYSECC